MIETAPLQQPLELLDYLDELEQRVSLASHVTLFLEFDGTASAIVSEREEAGLDPEIRSSLTCLLRRPDTTVSILSGRTILDVQKRAGLAGVVYVGNHGLEIESNSTRFREPKAESLRNALRSLSLQLKLALCDVEGIEIEDKTLTLSVHFRNVNPALYDWVRSVVISTVERARCFGCDEHELALDVMPQVEWNKGSAVKWILREMAPFHTLPIYIGHDENVENAFESMGQGITIRVGDAAGSRAQYLAPDVHAVDRFLQWLDLSKPHASIANSRGAGR